MTTRREKILQKLNPKFLKVTPKLSGDAGSFIDLGSDDSLVSGAKELMIRFFKNKDLCAQNKQNSSQNETELTITTTKYNEKNEICELVTEQLSLTSSNNADIECEKPGRRLQKLKMELQEKMSAKWEEDYRKRVNESKIYNESKNKYEKKFVEDDEDENDEDDEHDSSLEETSQSNDEDGVAEELEDESSDDSEKADTEYDIKDDLASNANEADEHVSDCETNQKNNFEKDDDYQCCSLIPAYQPGGGMLYGGSELTQGDEGLPQNLFSPSLRLSMNELSGHKLNEGINEATPKKSHHSTTEVSDNLFTSKMKLFSQNPNDSFDLNDAFEFCSGKFPDAEDNTEGEGESQNLNKVDEPNDDCVDNCENSQTNQGSKGSPESEKQIFKSRKNIIVFDESDEEDDLTKEPDEIEESQSVPLKILSDDEDELEEKQIFKMKKTRKSLHFSDEEDASNDFKVNKDNQEEESEISDEDLEENEDDQRSIQYDSEENEINPREFFEKEAELSGSEYSGDEDERGLDELDVEEGDADVLDNEQVRSELEKIHIRRVINDDLREVRLIQELLFEDGDLHSDEKKRDRKFKWKNLGTFDQDNQEVTKEEDVNDSEDDGNEEEIRKVRMEKELFLMTKQKNGELGSDDEIAEDFNSVKVTTVKPFVKPTALGENKTGNSKFSASITDSAKTARFSNTRGSFLTRNEEFLSRLAKATSSVTDNVLGPKNSKNFVFTTKSPEKENLEKNMTCKRQIEDAETCSRREKKVKLIPLEIDANPSILDLLV